MDDTDQRPFCVPAAAFLFAETATYGARTMEPFLGYPNLNRVFIEREGASGSNVIGTNRALLAVARTPLEVLWPAPQYDCWVGLDGDVQDHIRTTDAIAVWFYPQTQSYVITGADNTTIYSGACEIGRSKGRLNWRSLVSAQIVSPLNRDTPPCIGAEFLRPIGELAYIAGQSLRGHACDPDEGEEQQSSIRIYTGATPTAILIQTENPLYMAILAPRNVETTPPLDAARFVWPPWSSREGV